MLTTDTKQTKCSGDRQALYTIHGVLRPASALRCQSSLADFAGSGLARNSAELRDFHISEFRAWTNLEFCPKFRQKTVTLSLVDPFCKTENRNTLRNSDI